jgi:hypothetical protein
MRRQNDMGSCCAKPTTRIIKIGTSDAGIIGLEEMFKNAYTSGKTSDEELKSELLALARDSGNYIATGMEQAYEDALLREYRSFCKKQ